MGDNDAEHSEDERLSRRDRRIVPAILASLTLVHLLLVVCASQKAAIVWIELPLLAPLVVLAWKRRIGPVLPLCHATALIYQLVDPAVAVPWIFWFAVTLLYFVLESCKSRRALFGWGFWTGLMIATGIYAWLFDALHTFFEFGYAAAFALFLAIAVPIGAQLAIFLPLARWMADRTKLPLWLLVPPLYAMVEFWMPLPFPIALPLGFSRQPVVLQFADIAGTAGVTFLVASASVAIAVAIRGAMARDRRRAAWGTGAAAVCIATHLGYGAWAMKRYAPTEDAESVRIALVQPVAPLKVANKDVETKARTAETLKRLSLEALDASPDLVIWPEGAGAFASRTPAFNPEYMDAIREIQALHETPFLVQDIEFTRLRESDKLRYYSTAGIVFPDGSVSEPYRKNIRMPFSEYLPFEERFPVLREWLPEARSVLAGEESATLDAPGGPVLPVICYEILFPDFVRRGAAGSRFIANLTNDRWYGERQQPLQHQTFAVLRAIENRQPVVRCTNSGISALIDARGIIAGGERTATMEVATLTGDIHPRAGHSFYGRHGDLFARWMLTPAVLLLVALPWLPAWRRRTGVSS